MGYGEVVGVLDRVLRTCYATLVVGITNGHHGMEAVDGEVGLRSVPTCVLDVKGPLWVGTPSPRLRWYSNRFRYRYSRSWVVRDRPFRATGERTKALARTCHAALNRGGTRAAVPLEARNAQRAGQ